MEISSLFLGLCNVPKDISQHNWVSRACTCCSISIILAINCSSFSWFCLRKERVALVSSCALSVDAPFPFLKLLLVLAHFGAAFLLLTPLEVGKIFLSGVA